MGISILKEPSLRVVIADCWVTIGRGLSCIKSSRKTLNTFDALMARAQSEGKNVFLVALDQRPALSPNVAAMLLLSLLYNLDKLGQGPLADAVGMLRLFHNVARAKGTFEQRLLDTVLVTTTALLELSRTNTWDDRLTTRSRDGLRRMALLLSEAGKLPEANACILSAVNISLKLPPASVVPIAKTALSIALKLRDPEVIAASILRQAQALVFAAETIPNFRIDAFDAVEVAVRNLPESGEMRQPFQNTLAIWLEQKQYLKILFPLFWSTMHTEERSAIPGLAPDDLGLMVSTMSQLWKGDSKQWLNAMHKVGTLWVEVENQRLNLAKSNSANLVATATWDSWSIVHPNLLHSIPHSKSLLRENNLHDYLLTLSHEITHIFSMTGPAGIATTAMRWALFDLDLELWTLSFKQDSFAMDEIVRHMLESAESSPLAWWRMPQDELTVHRLARIEQALILVRKIQNAEDTWSPWFEGLAIFSESADPQLDEKTYSPVANVVSQLIDRNMEPASQDQGRSRAELFREQMVKAEELYSEAIRLAEPTRLRTHIGVEFKRYLAGYLLVRSIVASWRQTLGRELTGTEAFMLLLHVTRFSSLDDVVPDVRLDISEFQKELKTKHREWLRSIALISKADLTASLGAYESAAKPMYWEQGQLQHPTEDYPQETLTRVARVTQDALRPTFVTPERRVPQAMAGSPLHDLMLVMGELREVQPSMFVEKRIPLILERNWILPIGRVKSPFWILEADHLFACLLRTTETNKELKASYDLLAFSMPQDKLADLKREMEKTRDTRIEVTRVADLADYDETRGRGLGRNLLAFRLGEWLYVQPRGLLFGSDDVHDDLRSSIESRLSPHQLVSAHERLSADLRGFGARALEWLDNVDSTVATPSHGRIDFSRWLRYVKDLANQVVKRQIGQADMSTYLDCLQFVVDEADVAIRLQEQGLEPLRDYSPELVQEFLDLLVASGQRPVVSDRGEVVFEAVRQTLGLQFNNSQEGWDIVPASAWKEGFSNGNHNPSKSTSI